MAAVGALGKETVVVVAAARLHGVAARGLRVAAAVVAIEQATQAMSQALAVTFATTWIGIATTSAAGGRLSDDDRGRSLLVAAARSRNFFTRTRLTDQQSRCH